MRNGCKKRLGSALPFRARDLTHRSINFTFPVYPGESQQLYFRITSDGSLQFPLALGTRDYFSGVAQQSLFYFRTVLRAVSDDNYLLPDCLVQQP